jgi:NAD(P)-dependent dehydrogenase (short-subunit alcohol dehydrogenase family)
LSAPALDLSGRVALITGAAKSEGLGAACARLFSARGAKVVVTDIASSGLSNMNEADLPPDREEWRGLDSLVAELRASGGEALALTGDVSQWPDADSMVEQAVAAFGRLDILVSNAAAPQGLDRADLVDMPVGEFDRIMQVNVRGGFMMCRAALPVMRRNRYGRIIIISSIRGKDGRARHTLYSASKAALLGMTRSLALDTSGEGITVNAVCPGQMLTSRLLSRTPAEASGSALDLEAEMARRAAQIPAGFIGKAPDVAEVVAFLASSEARYLNAQAITVDGGQHPY